MDEYSASAVQRRSVSFTLPSLNLGLGGGARFFLLLTAPGLADRTRTTNKAEQSSSVLDPFVTSLEERRPTLGVDSTRDAVHSSVVELGKGVLYRTKDNQINIRDPPAG